MWRRFWERAGVMSLTKQSLSWVETCHHTFKMAIIIHGGICSLLPPAKWGRMMSHLVTQQNHLECFPCFRCGMEDPGTTVLQKTRMKNADQAISNDFKTKFPGLHWLETRVCTTKHWLLQNIIEEAISKTLQATFKAIKWSTMSLRSHYLTAVCGPCVWMKGFFQHKSPSSLIIKCYIYKFSYYIIFLRHSERNTKSSARMGDNHWRDGKFKFEGKMI